MERNDLARNTVRRGSRWARRAVAVGTVVAALGLMSSHVASAETLLAAGTNPFDNVLPDFGVFGLEFTQAWQKLLGGVWGIGFVVTAFSAIRAVVALARAKKGGYGVQVAEQTEDAKWAGIAFVALTMLGVVVGGLIAIFQ
ncbi:hypothetical protein GS538_09105 [Rhodococcus hoagii]|nr:hypothetical protein [Prescottella equi]